MVLDDSHACVDAIRDSITIKIKKSSQVYAKILALFTECLKSQGLGTFSDIENGSYEDFQSVPYWEWQDHAADVVQILSSHKNDDEIKFAWELIKDEIQYCQCVVSGTALEISPYLPPLEKFGSYWNANHRVFMSATVTNDSFLIKGLRLLPETIESPLVVAHEKWSGEKMIVIPSLIDPSLDRETIVHNFATPPAKPRNFGLVALVPSWQKTADWKRYGANVVDTSTIGYGLGQYQSGNYAHPLVLVNRYDGIDLPDKMCRVLVFDSKPHSESLVERYVERCIPNSDLAIARTVRIIEQGLGRGVRGEKDYCVAVIVGSDLVQIIKTREGRRFLSEQTKAQIEIGLEITEIAKKEIEGTGAPEKVLIDIVSKCLNRDAGWKDFYTERMNDIKASHITKSVLNIFQIELRAELLYRSGEIREAQRVLQEELVDKHITDCAVKGWYLQEMGRYSYSSRKADSNQLQIAAHKMNHSLLKPRTGMEVETLTVSGSRLKQFEKAISRFASFSELMLCLDTILSDLSFGVQASSFEKALDDLGNLLGFRCQRPDNEWGAGPDNLWGLEKGKMLLVECKNQVDLKRAQIYKEETGQMNNACAWFDDKYSGSDSVNIMIIPTNELGKGAGFNKPVQIMTNRELGKLKTNVRSFFMEFEGCELKSLDAEKIQRLYDTHGLTVEALISKYSRKYRKGEKSS